jgi:hypothetical protein
MMDETANPFDTGYARSQLSVLFHELVFESRRIDALLSRARDQNLNDDRVGRARAYGELVDDRLTFWLHEWQPPEPPN